MPKRVVKVKLVVDEPAATALRSTLATMNAAATYVAAWAFTHRDAQGRTPNRFATQKAIYAEVRGTFALGAQPTIRVIKKAVDANASLRANLLAGNFGKAGSPRRTAVESRPVSFRPTASQAFDDRCLTWDHERQTISILTSHGRLRAIPFVGRPSDLSALAAYRSGEADLAFHDGKWYLVATLEIPTPDVSEPTAGFIGVDMGVVNIATTAASSSPSTATIWSGGAVTSRRKRNRRLRKKLQAKGTRSAKRLLRHRSQKETRFVADVNHQISKSIVAEAERTGHGVAVEDLGGIRDRVRLRRPQRATVHSWAFAQLGQFLAYKAETAGVAFLQVDPAFTSQTCSRCGYTDRLNRVSQARFECRGCGVVAHADHNAAVNIALRGVDGWAAINQPAGGTPASREHADRIRGLARVASLAL